MPNDHLWKDDNQIVEIHSFKQYAEEPKIILEVRKCNAGRNTKTHIRFDCGSRTYLFG